MIYLKIYLHKKAPVAKQKPKREVKKIRVESDEEKPVGRPYIKLDHELLFELGKLHCTMNEIASICKCSVDTLERNYADIIKSGMEEGKRSLRRLQWGLAEKGNLGMLVWLGKQLLGQRDRMPEEVPHTTFQIQLNEVPK